MIRKIKKETLFYIMLILACMNFFRMGSTIVLASCLFLFAWHKFQLKINRIGWIYISLMLVMFVVSIFWYSAFDVIKVLNYGFCYLLGFNSYFWADDPQQHVRNSIGSLYVGSLAYVLLLFVINLDTNSIYRVLVDVWTGEYIAVTLVAVISSIVMGYSVYLLFFNDNKFLKAVALVSVIMVIILNFKTATRTVFLLGAFVLAIGYGLKLYCGTARKIGKYIGWAVALAMLALILYQMDFMNIKSNIVGSFLWERFSNMSDVDIRFELFSDHWKYALQYPFGGRRVSLVVGQLAHNFLQDFYDNFGVMSTVLLIVIIFNVIRNLFRLIKRRNSINTEKVLILLYSTILLQLCTEPIITGYPIFMWILFMIDGFASAYLGEVAKK